MSAYTIHADQCGTCKGFDHPGQNKYSTPSRCAVGVKLYMGPDSVEKPRRDPLVATPPTPLLRTEPETFDPPLVGRRLDPEDEP